MTESFSCFRLESFIRFLENIGHFCIGNGSQNGLEKSLGKNISFCLIALFYDDLINFGYSMQRCRLEI